MEQVVPQTTIRAEKGTLENSDLTRNTTDLRNAPNPLVEITRVNDDVFFSIQRLCKEYVPFLIARLTTNRDHQLS